MNYITRQVLTLNFVSKKPGVTVNENFSDLQNLEKPLLSTQAGNSRWVLKVVYLQFTFRSYLGLSKLFQSVCGNNDAIKHFSYAGQSAHT